MRKGRTLILSCLVFNLDKYCYRRRYNALEVRQSNWSKVTCSSRFSTSVFYLLVVVLRLLTFISYLPLGLLFISYKGRGGRRRSTSRGRARSTKTLGKTKALLNNKMYGEYTSGLNYYSWSLFLGVPSPVPLRRVFIWAAIVAFHLNRYDSIFCFVLKLLIF